MVFGTVDTNREGWGFFYIYIFFFIGDGGRMERVTDNREERPGRC